MDKVVIPSSKMTTVLHFKVIGWSRRSHWSSFYIDPMTIPQSSINWLLDFSMWIFHQSKSHTEGKQNVCKYSTAVSMLSTWPKIELYIWRMGSGSKIVTKWADKGKSTIVLTVVQEIWLGELRESLCHHHLTRDVSGDGRWFESVERDGQEPVRAPPRPVPSTERQSRDGLHRELQTTQASQSEGQFTFISHFVVYLFSFVDQVIN